MKYCAIFVDTRIGHADVIKQHMKHLPSDWDLHIFTSEEAIDYYCNKAEPTVIHTVKINSEADYNKLLTSVEFWDNFLEYEKVLIFQHDSMILRNNIGDFLKYDYIGAPWAHTEFGGNGGLSLRCPNVMKYICEKYPYTNVNDCGNEDIYFCNIMEKNYTGYLADRDSCSKFSMEVIYQENTFGVHAIEKYHDAETVNKIKAQEEQ